MRRLTWPKSMRHSSRHMNSLAESDESLAKSGGEDREAFDAQMKAIEDLGRPLTAIQSKGYDLNWK